MEENVRKNPWLGLESYKEGEILYGRDDDIRDLSQCVLNDRDTLLYGKSGIGKSSILNAGILPAARRDGFLPILVRLSHKDQHSYLYQINQSIINALLNQKSDLNFLVSSSCNDDFSTEEVISLIKEIVPCKNTESESLYEYFHRHTFHAPNGERVKLLIIFDQFEEIFTLQEDVYKKKQFFAHLADLLNDVMPDELQQKVEISPDSQDELKVVREDDLDNIFGDISLDIREEFPEYVSDNEIHFVFTIREDFLSEFEYYSALIPSLKQNRYALRPINEEQAAQIILRPIPGLIDKSVAKLIIEKISGKKDFKLDGLPEIEVDSAVLSLYLQHLYDAQKGDIITKDLVEEKGGEIIFEFYHNAIAGISDSSIEYLEDKLLNGQGRRDNITVYDAVNAGRISVEELDILCERKKILRKFNHGGDLRIEYVHDILCPVVKSHKEERTLLKLKEEQQKQFLIEEDKKRKALEQRAFEEKKRLKDEARRMREKNRKRISFLVILLIFTISIGSLLVYHNNSLVESNNILVEQQDKILKSQQKLMSLKIKQLMNDDDSYTARRLCLNVQSIRQTNDTENIPSYFIDILRYLSNNNNAILKGHSNAVVDVAFSPINSYVASASDSTIIIWNSNNGQIIRTITGNGGNILSVAFSPDENKLAVGSDNGTVHVYNVNTGEECYPPLIKHKKGVRYVTFSPDGKKIFSASKDKSICMWNADKGEFINIVANVHEDEVLFLAFSKDYKKMASASADKIIKIWNINLADNTCSVSRVLKEHKDWVRSVGFNPVNDNQLVSSSDDGTLRIWNIENGSNVLVHNTNSYVTRAVFSPDGRNVIASYRDGTVRIWDVETGVENRHMQCFHNNYVNAVAVSNDGRKFVSAGSDMLVRLWDMMSYLHIGKYQAHADKILHITSDGEKLVSVGDDNKVSCFDMHNMDAGPLWEQTIDNKKFQRSIINSKKNIVAFVGYKTIIIRDLATGKLLNRKDDAHKNWIYAVDSSPDGQYLVTGGMDGNIVIWDWDLNLKKMIPRGHNGIITSLKYSHKGDRIVSTSADCSVKIWDVEGDDVVVFDGHSDDVLYATFNKNDSLLLTGSSDKTARIWDIKTKECKIFSGHGGVVNHALFGENEREIITVSSDNLMRIWNVCTQQELLTLYGHTKSISSIIYDDEESNLITSSWDSTIQIWDYPSVNEIIKDITTRFGSLPLTDDELRMLDIL